MQHRPFRRPTTALIFIAAALGLAVPCAGASPTPVSPGDAEAEARVQGRCPTFSWTEADGAKGYELALYRVEETEGAEAVGDAEPELLDRVRLPAGSTGWTPSLDRCLDRGGRHAWSVRALRGGEPGEWSEASLFRVSGVPSAAEVESAIETLRRFLQAEAGTRPEQEPEKRRAEDAPAPATDAVRNPLGSVRSGKDRTERKPGTLTSFEAPQSAPTLTPKVAPSVGTPSLSLDSNVRLGSDSNFFRLDRVFLWSDFSSDNLALGLDALASAAGFASENTAVGKRALTETTGGSVSSLGSRNTGIGSEALVDNTTGKDNTAVGSSALADNTTGSGNTALGENALLHNTTGDENVAIGRKAGIDLGLFSSPSTSLSHNIYIAHDGQPDEEGTIRIGSIVDHKQIFVAGIEGNYLGEPGSKMVHVAPNGRLGTSSCGSYQPAASCPLGSGSPDGPKCSEVPTGSFCETDGECGLNNGLDNCGDTDWYLRVD